MKSYTMYLLLTLLLVITVGMSACAFTSPTPTPTPVPTSTPTSTPTPLPTATPSPTPIPSPTPTPTATPIQVAWSDKDALPLLNPEEVQVPEDWLWFESKAFSFRIAYPPEWLALDLTADEWESVLQHIADENVKALLDDQVRRLVASQTAALITSAVPENVEGQPFVSNVNILRTQIPAEMSQDVVLQGIINNLKQLRGLRLESFNRGNIHGYPAAATLYTYPLRDEDGHIYPVVGWQVYVRPKPESLYVMTFTTIASAFDDRIVTFARMAGSFRLLSDGNE